MEDCLVLTLGEKAGLGGPITEQQRSLLKPVWRVG